MSRDLRRYASQTNRRLVFAGLLLLLVLGDGLIYLFYGQQAALAGLACFLIGLAPLALIWLALALIQWIVQRAQRDTPG